MSTISQATKVMHNLIKMEFFHPETNIKIIRRNDAGAIVEKGLENISYLVLKTYSHLS